MSLANLALRHAIKGGLRLGFKLPSALPLPVRLLRVGMDAGARLLPLRAGAEITTVTLQGVSAERACMANAGKLALLHLHGGAFMVGSPASHRGLATELAVRTGAAVYVPDYRLAPEHAYPAALDDCSSAWQGLLEAGFAPEQIIVSGDSAGAALALSLCLRLKQEGRAMPAALVLLSPYVDSSLSAASVTRNRYRDPMLTRKVLARGSAGYCGALAAADPHISPLFAELAGLPPLLIQVGSEEILLDDALQLAALAKTAGVAVVCHVHEGMWHDFQLFSRLLSEADAALDEVAEFIRSLS